MNFNSDNNITYAIIISGTDFKNLPPCQSVLEKKIIRANYIAYMIKQAIYNTIDPPSEGWSTDEYGKMSIDYFEGDPFPKNIKDITLQSDDEELEEPIYDSTDSEHEFEDDD